MSTWQCSSYSSGQPGGGTGGTGEGGARVLKYSLGYYRQETWKHVAEFDEGEGVVNILVAEHEDEERENITEL